VKHGVKSYGVGIPELREIMHEIAKNQFIHESISIQTECLHDLFRHNYTESKIAAVLFIQLYWKSVVPAISSRRL
jgi:hypothetical protein